MELIKYEVPMAISLGSSNLKHDNGVLADLFDLIIDSVLIWVGSCQ